MNLEVTVSREYLSPVLADLAQRRGNIQEIQSRQDNKVVIGYVPLAEIMVGTLWLNLHILHKLLEKSQGFSPHRCGCVGEGFPVLHKVWAVLYQNVSSASMTVFPCRALIYFHCCWLSQFFLSFFSPPASPALGQASKCQQSLYQTLGLGNTFEAYPRSWFSVLHGTYQIFPDNGQKMYRERSEA